MDSLYPLVEEMYEALKDLVVAVRDADNWEDNGLHARSWEMKAAQAALDKADLVLNSVNEDTVVTFPETNRWKTLPFATSLLPRDVDKVPPQNS